MPVIALEPLILRDLLDSGELDAVEAACTFKRHPSPATYTSFDGRTEFSPVPELIEHVAPMVAGAAADHFGVVLRSLQVTVLRYWPGVGHDWHADGSGQYPMSARRVLSFSLLLNEPGRDFTGGGFETQHGPVDLHAGDVAVFTAATRHRVLPVETGHRLVLVCFGSA